MTNQTHGFKNRNDVAKRVAEVVPQAFLVAADEDRGGRTIVTAHVMREFAQKGLRRKLADSIGQIDQNARVRVKSHKPSRMMTPSSLEAWAKPFSHETIVADPTGVYARMAGLVAFADMLREATEQTIAGIHWNGDWRTVYVVLDDGGFVTDGKLKTHDLARVEDIVQDCLHKAFPDADAFLPVVRLGFEMPGIPVVPVDEASHLGGSASFLPWFRRYGLFPALGSLLTFGAIGAASAADLAPHDSMGNMYPAVSGPNGKLAIVGGYQDVDGQDSDGLSLLTGSFTVPLGQQFGFQVDGLVGLADVDQFAGGVGAHLFWRDPNVGLLGLTGSYASRGRANGRDPDATYVGAEGELYIDQFTIAAAVGSLFGKGLKDGFRGKADVMWYATDDFMLRAGGEYSEQQDASVRFGAEYRPGFVGVPGMSLFADGLVGDNDYVRVLAGFRFYFGESLTLRDRHRKDDPFENVAQTAFDAASSVPRRTPAQTAAAPAFTGRCDENAGFETILLEGSPFFTCVNV